MTQIEAFPLSRSHRNDTEVLHENLKFKHRIALFGKIFNYHDGVQADNFIFITLCSQCPSRLSALVELVNCPLGIYTAVVYSELPAGACACQ